MKRRVKPLVSFTDASVEYLFAQTQRPSPLGMYSESGVWNACSSVRSAISQVELVGWLACISTELE